MKTLLAIIVGVAGLIALGTVGGSFYTVNQNEVGLLFRYGALVGEVTPGLHGKTPWIDAVQTYEIAWYPVSKELITHTKDNQKVTVQASISWALNPKAVICMPTSYKTEENIGTSLIEPKFMNAVGTIFGQYTASDSIEKRAEMQTKMAKAIEDDVLAVQPCGDTAIAAVQNFNLEEVQFDPAYDTAIVNKMVAQQAALQEKAAADQRAAKAEGEARATVAAADAQAHQVQVDGEARAAAAKAVGLAEASAIEARGLAEAKAIDAKGKALKANPEANPQLMYAQKWDGKLPTSMIPGTTLPFMSLKAPE